MARSCRGAYGSTTLRVLRNILKDLEDRTMSLLLVHTDSDDRAMYAEYLRAEGFSVEEIGTTDAALPLVPDVEAVITGLLVPGTIDALEFIRVVKGLCRTPIIVVTACVFTDRMEKAQHAGADVVLVKPCLPDTLLHEVRQAIELHRMQKGRATSARESSGGGFGADVSLMDSSVSRHE